MPGRRVRYLGVLAALVALIVFAAPVTAELYKWVDDKGKKHFTNDPTKIPLKYRAGEGGE